MSEKQKKNLKSFSYIKVDPLVHEELVGECNKRGVNPAYYVGWVLADAVDAGLHKLDGQDRSVFWKARELTQIKRDRDIVRTAALSYLMYPTDDGADLLAEMCEDVGLDYNEILGDVTDDRFAMLRTSQDSVFVERAEWLYNLLSDNSGRLTVKYIRSRGEECGYTKYTIDKTRKFINEQPDFPTIVSVKAGSQWVWQLEKIPG